MKTLTDLIARHVPDKDHAIKLVAAVEIVTGMAESYLEDLQAGVDEGLYEEQSDVKMYIKALELVDD